jgi:hypothetical protein
LALKDDAFEICFDSPCKCAIRISEEISPSKIIGDLPNSLDLLSAIAEFLKEDLSRLCHSTGQILNINANELLMSAALLYPNLNWLCMDRIPCP